MQEIPDETANSIAAAQAAMVPRPLPAERTRARLRLGIGGRLALGLAAVAGVIITLVASVMLWIGAGYGVLKALI